MNMIPPFLMKQQPSPAMRQVGDFTPPADDAVADELERALTPAADKAKQAATDAREELQREICAYEDDILAREGRIISHEASISEERTGIMSDKTLIAERKAVIAVLDRAKADIEALDKPAPERGSKSSTSTKRRSRKAAEA
jgi:hypothetical protein